MRLPPKRGFREGRIVNTRNKDPGKRRCWQVIIDYLAIGSLIVTLAPISGLARQDNLKQDGQTSGSTSKAAPAQTPSAIRIGELTISGSLRARLENWSWFETSAAEPDYTFGAAVLRLSLSQQRERFDWQVEGEFPALINLPERSIAPAPQGQLGLGASYFAANGEQDASAILKQAFVRLKGLGGDKPSSFRIGRFEFVDGAETTPEDPTLAVLKRDHIAHRLIGTFGFSHVGRSFDGAQYARNTRTSNITVVAARPTEGVFQLRGLRELDVDFYYGAYTRQLPGKTTQGEARAFVLHYHDGRGALKTDNRPLALRQADGENIRLTSIGGHYIGAIKAAGGAFDLLVWGVAQFGDWGRLSHRAGAIAAEAGFQPGGGFAARLKPWLRAGYYRGSGDGDPTDADHTTFFQVLPTPRIYARFPFYNLMNNEDVFAQLRIKPHTRLSLRGDVRYLRLANEKDLWYLGGGAFQENTFGYVGRPSGGNKTLGTLFDLSVDYNVASRTTLTLYVGGVRGGRVPRSIYPSGGKHPGAHFVYLEFTQRF
jgi:Alginate export